MGKLAVIKTKPTSSSVEDFINGLKDEQKRKNRQQAVNRYAAA